MADFKLKEKCIVRKIDICDREDHEDSKFSFEIRLKVHQGRDHSVIILCAKSAEEKSNWMAALVSLQTRSMLERKLDGILKSEEKQQPLLDPHPDYRFSKPNSDENIIFEEKYENELSTECPQIKGGTLLKLVERLTFHMYSDPKFVKTFLTTYRSFSNPHELMDFLIERYYVIDPIQPDPDTEDADAVMRNKEDLKRFRKEYVKPVQFRVVNVLRQWVDHHFYDFERDDSLLEELEKFLESIKGKAMRKMAESIWKLIKRRKGKPNTEREFKHHTEFPAIEVHIAKTYDEYDLMTLHPIEIARQVTLLESDMYRAVKPSELIGNVWTKKDKHKTSPNLLKLIHFSTNFTFWLEKCIIETKNLEERVCVMSRIIEIMLVFLELNNFNGVLEVVSALNSASVYRLEFTKEKLPDKYVKAFDEAKELNSDHFKKYVEKLRSIDPPCVPFTGMYLTNILHTEEGNSDFLQHGPLGLINFSKRRKLAEITAEIQQYQNQRYCLQTDTYIRQYLEKLDPLGDMDDKVFMDYLFFQSLEIDPKKVPKPPKFPKKFDYPLKSPGIKPGMGRHWGTGPRHIKFGSHSGYTKMTEEDSYGSDTSSLPLTPTPPTTPLTPPASGANDNSVFSNVNINMSTVSLNSVFSTSSRTSGTIHTNPSTYHTNSMDDSLMDNEPSQPTPPPLPPRRRNTDSMSSDILGVPPLPPPPRVDRSTSSEILIKDVPPPIPPRRESMSMFSTMPRTQGSSAHSRISAISSTLPRRNSDRGYLGPTVVNYNGDSENTPELPPRGHVREKSS